MELVECPEDEEEKEGGDEPFCDPTNTEGWLDCQPKVTLLPESGDETGNEDEEIEKRR